MADETLSSMLAIREAAAALPTPAEVAHKLARCAGGCMHPDEGEEFRMVNGACADCIAAAITARDEALNAIWAARLEALRALLAEAREWIAARDCNVSSERPTIEELERLLNEPTDAVVQIRPDGSIFAAPDVKALLARIDAALAGAQPQAPAQQAKEEGQADG